MDVSEVLARLDAERRTVCYDGTVLDPRPLVTRWHSTDGTLHGVNGSTLTPATADAAIDEEVAHHAALDVGFEWKVYAHDGPADLLDRLRRRGFTVGPHEAVMVYDLARPAVWPAGGEVKVERVDRLDQVEVYKRVAGEVFGKDYAFTATQLAEAIAAGSTQHRGYVASASGTPAGVARLYLHPASAFGGLYGGGTLPAFRGRGVYRATVAARAADAAAAGARYLIVDALPTSRPILERLGFVHVSDTWPCEWASREDLAPVR
ncbi:MAG TPA: GNAT family N-acetyltransferase [Humisphaera sp.]